MKLNNLKTFCMFIGYPRSGHTLLGSIIDAHPYATIAQEENIVLWIKQGRYRTKEQIIKKCIDNSSLWKGKRMWSGYSYWIPNQYNATPSPEMTVVGDKKGGETTAQFMNNPHLVVMLKRILDPLPIKWIHGIRNPFDNIATWSYRRPDFGLDFCIDEYFRRASYCQEFRKHNMVFDITNDMLIESPEQTLTDMMLFLDLEPYDDYIKDCASMVFKNPRKTRFNIEWTNEQLNRVYEGCSKIDFLKNYTMES